MIDLLVCLLALAQPPGSSNGPPNGKPPPQPTPIQGAATKQFDIDRTAYAKYQSSYYAMVQQMYWVNQSIFDLGRLFSKQTTTLSGPDYDKTMCAMRRAEQDGARAQKALAKADFALNNMGAQFFAIERSAFYFGDYAVSLAIGQLSKQYWDDGFANLSAAEILLGDAGTQFDIARLILLGPNPDIQGPGAPDAKIPPIVGPPGAPP